MSDTYTELRNKIANAIRKACTELAEEHDSDGLHGFALCTDDDVMTLFPAACTKSWVAERINNYDGIGSIYTEWDQNSGDSHFDSLSEEIADLAGEADEQAADRRFEAFVLALLDCRDAGVFDFETLLCCGSTDPSDHLEMLAMRAVDRLNSPAVANLFAHHLGYEQHRVSNG